MPSNVAIAVLGAGAWGTALAAMLARRGTRTTLCVRRASQLSSIKTSHENSSYLPGIALPESLSATDEWPGAIAKADVVVIAIPSAHARASLAPLADAFRSDAIVVSATKGIENDTLCTMTQMIAEVVPQSSRIAVLSGPGFAAEVARGRPAALVAAAREQEVARQIQELFAMRSLRVYSSTDVAGVEICGATKNVVAIAAGVSDGLELGSSARAALITRGLAEIMRLVEAAGGRRETAAGLAGLGDLVLTCTGDLSRNRAVGLAFARGERPNLDDAKPTAGRKSIAEGIANARSVRALAARLKVEMPIVSAVYRGLYEGQAPNAMVEELLSRGLKAEF
ncbi:MAG TPA: NAD(P)H-dependent glycerol-3-phosphate dehydrogenase [Candidatus Binataceae bacterium]|nr:NAD(P)H-dependent glycerol-3-phosphate dehydrogenase [Candidatus Binataceae bacterium]